LAFHKSPSKLNITVCPSGVRHGLERKYASLSCADNKAENIKKRAVKKNDRIAIGLGREYTAIPFYCNTVYGK
jgi:hypothetical protein